MFSSKHIAVAETLAVFVAIMLYIWRLRFVAPRSWIAIFGVVLVSHLLRKESPTQLGFRWTEFPALLAELRLQLFLLTTALLVFGFLGHTFRNIPWQSALSGLAGYCVWGLFQQYVLNGYFVNRFLEFLPAESVPYLAAAAFSAVHTPNWLLMIVTAAGGYWCAWWYQRRRNLYALGVAHGLVGFLIYLVVPDSVSHYLHVGPKWFTH